MHIYWSILQVWVYDSIIVSTWLKENKNIFTLYNKHVCHCLAIKMSKRRQYMQHHLNSCNDTESNHLFIDDFLWCFLNEHAFGFINDHISCNHYALTLNGIKLTRALVDGWILKWIHHVVIWLCNAITGGWKNKRRDKLYHTWWNKSVIYVNRLY